MKSKTNGEIEIEVEDGFTAELAQSMATRLDEIAVRLDGIAVTEAGLADERKVLIEEQGKLAEALLALRIS